MLLNFRLILSTRSNRQKNQDPPNLSQFPSDAQVFLLHFRFWVFPTMKRAPAFSSRCIDRLRQIGPFLKFSIFISIKFSFFFSKKFLKKIQKFSKTAEFLVKFGRPFFLLVLFLHSRGQIIGKDFGHVKYTTVPLVSCICPFRFDWNFVSTFLVIFFWEFWWKLWDENNLTTGLYVHTYSK